MKVSSSIVRFRITNITDIRKIKLSLTTILALFEINLFPSFVYLSPLIFEKGISGIFTFNISDEDFI